MTPTLAPQVARRRPRDARHWLDALISISDTMVLHGEAHDGAGHSRAADRASPMATIRSLVFVNLMLLPLAFAVPANPPRQIDGAVAAAAVYDIIYMRRGRCYYHISSPSSTTSQHSYQTLSNPIHFQSQCLSLSLSKPARVSSPLSNNSPSRDMS